ncbi:MAG TPA: pilin [Candidatus Paceibacterota bacterium]|nr:pilin [Candidatus Paceibacterota bacterium]
MKKIGLLFPIVLVLSFLAPLSVQGADISCSEQQAGSQVQYVCDITGEMEKPGNCDLFGATQLKCSGEPNGYTCSGSGTAHTCDLTPAVCTAASGGYDCPIPVSGRLPSGCSSSGGGMHCTAAPSGYTVTTSSTASPTSVSPTSATTQSSSGNTNRGSSNSNGNISYTPLEPLLPDAPANIASDFGAYLNLMFKLFLSVGALLAVGRLVVGGIMYMTSEVMETKGDAKRWMTSSIYGLLLLAGSWLILYTINPDLLKFNLVVPGSNNTPAAQQQSVRNVGSYDKGDHDSCEALYGNYKIGPDGSYSCVKASAGGIGSN